MKRIPALLLTVSLSAGPMMAQEAGEGADALRDGAGSLLRDLLDEVGPRMKELSDALRGMEIQGLGIEDLDDYRAPEVLPNGDIIIRRRTPIERPLADGEVEL